MEEVKSIVFAGLKQEWAYNNIISQIMFAIADKEELELLGLWCDMEDLPELTDKAENCIRNTEKNIITPYKTTILLGGNHHV